MAEYGVYFVLLKWVTCPLAAIYLIFQHNYILAILAIFWPMLAAFLGIIIGGTQIGIIQKMFMRRLGYNTEGLLSSESKKSNPEDLSNYFLKR